MYVRARVNNLATFTYNFPALDPSLVLYYPMDSSANPSNGFQTANFASKLPVYDASMSGSAMITYALNNSVTSFGDLSLNNTMGAQLVPQTVSGNYVVSNTSFALNISGGFSVSLWFSCSGQLNKRGTLISLPLNKTSNGIQIDISGPNMIYTGYNVLPVGQIDLLSTTTRTALLSPTTITNGGACAFALKLLYSGYTGPIIRIQRSSDNAVSNFYADTNGNLGTDYLGTGTSFSAWLTQAGGTPAAYVLKWYDQTGNGNDASGNYTGTSTYPTLTNETLAGAGAAPTGYYVSLNSTNGSTGLSYFTLPNGALPYGDSNYSFVIKTYYQANDSGYRPIIGGGDSTIYKSVTGIRFEPNGVYNHLWFNADYTIAHASNLTHTNEVATFTYNSTVSTGTKYYYFTQSTGTTTSGSSNAATFNNRAQTNTFNSIGTHANYVNTNFFGTTKLYSICALPYDLQLNTTDRKILEAI